MGLRKLIVLLLALPAFSQVVVVGDSLMCSIAPHIELKLGHPVIKDCRVGSSLRHWIKERPASELMVVEIGTNDSGISLDNYRGMVRRFLKGANTRRILWLGIPQMPGKLGEKTSRLNCLLREEALQDPRVLWIDPTPALGKGSRAKDGIHLSFKGAVRVANLLPLNNC